MITQSNYPDLEIDDSEKDVVMIIGYEKHDPQIILIEREKLKEFIDKLKKLIR